MSFLLLLLLCCELLSHLVDSTLLQQLLLLLLLSLDLFLRHVLDRLRQRLDKVLELDEVAA